MFQHTTPKAVTCPSCAGPALSYSLIGRQFTECDPCANAERARREAETRRIRAVSAWEARTPPDMARAVNWALVAPNLKPVHEADETSGICMVGATSSGKTRLGYWLLKKLAILHGITGRCVSHAEFRRAASSQHSNDPKRADASHSLIESCRSVPALLIDDIGKGSGSPAADEAFFDLLTHRRDNHLLTHWTANAGSQWLTKRFGEDKGKPIVIRLARLAPQCFIVPEPAKTPAPKS